jgi:8-oxo-dGTP pyrophosphatase MutT (NUDIX family)
VAAGSFRQHVPRPATARPGELPPWSRLDPARRASVPLSVVRRALAAGGDRGLADGEPPRPGVHGARVGGAHGARIDAAVLLAVFEEEGETRAVLIRRSPHLQRDPGHVALPGGLVEPDEAPLAAALREAEEEIGLDPALVEIVGPLDVVHRQRFGDRIAPFVGLLARRPTLRPSAAEVDVTLEVPLADLLADGVGWEERWEIADMVDRPVHFFAAPDVLGDDLVWGVTARILWDLLERVAERLAAAPGP